MDTEPPKPKTAPSQEVACTVLVTGTVIGNAVLAKGAKLRMQKSAAETLASLNPPKISIDGI